MRQPAAAHLSGIVRRDAHHQPSTFQLPSSIEILQNWMAFNGYGD
jgi:hypothetical protein